MELLSIDVSRDIAHEKDGSRTLGAGEYYVLGDNATNSRDSRAFGGVREEWIVGRAFAVAWPWPRARLLR